MRTLAIVLATVFGLLVGMAVDVPPALPVGAETVSTKFIGSFANDTVRFEVDYNDSNKRVVRVRCVNNGGGNARITLIDLATAEIVAQVTFPSGTTTYSVAGQAVTVNPDGSVSIPYEVRLAYPVP